MPVPPPAVRRAAADGLAFQEARLHVERLFAFRVDAAGAQFVVHGVD